MPFKMLNIIFFPRKPEISPVNIGRVVLPYYFIWPYLCSMFNCNSNEWDIMMVEGGIYFDKIKPLDKIE